MTAKLRIFVSSVQKELNDERLIVQNLVNTDGFLSSHCVLRQRTIKDALKIMQSRRGPSTSLYAACGSLLCITISLA